MQKIKLCMKRINESKIKKGTPKYIKIVAEPISPVSKFVILKRPI